MSPRTTSLFVQPRYFHCAFTFSSTTSPAAIKPEGPLISPTVAERWNVRPERPMSVSSASTPAWWFAAPVNGSSGTPRRWKTTLPEGGGWGVGAGVESASGSGSDSPPCRRRTKRRAAR